MHGDLNYCGAALVSKCDDIQAKLFKISAPAASESLCFVKCLKKGLKLDPGNYQPISKLPVIYKLLDRRHQLPNSPGKL